MATYCYICCREAYQEWLDLDEEEFATLFVVDTAKELQNRDERVFSSTSLEAIQEFIWERIQRGHYTLIVTDDDDRSYPIPACFKHWWQEQ